MHSMKFLVMRKPLHLVTFHKSSLYCAAHGLAVHTNYVCCLSRLYEGKIRSNGKIMKQEQHD